VTLSSFIAQKREVELREWFDKLPLDEAMRCADSYFEARNKLRREMFNIRVDLCDDCGLVFPPDDLTQIRKSDGRPYLVCCGCLDFGELVRAVLGWGRCA
jgi:hypothetical protein